MSNFAYNLTRRVNRLKVVSKITTNVGGRFFVEPPAEPVASDEAAFMYKISGSSATDDNQKIALTSQDPDDVLFYDARSQSTEVAARMEIYVNNNLRSVVDFTKDRVGTTFGYSIDTDPNSTEYDAQFESVFTDGAVYFEAEFLPTPQPTSVVIAPTPTPSSTPAPTLEPTPVPTLEPTPQPTPTPTKVVGEYEFKLKLIGDQEDVGQSITLNTTDESLDQLHYKEELTVGGNVITAVIVIEGSPRGLITYTSSRVGTTFGYKPDYFGESELPHVGTFTEAGGEISLSPIPAATPTPTPIPTSTPVVPGPTPEATALPLETATATPEPTSTPEVL
jgi:hypothetical protein